MTPTARNAAIAAAATLIPAAIAAAIYPDRARALPERISARVRDSFESDDFDSQARRALARLEALTDRLDRRDETSDPRPGLLAAGLALVLVVPAALTMLFPDRARAARDTALGYFRDTEDDEDRAAAAAVEAELGRVSQRLDALSTDIETARDANYEAVTKAAQNKG